ncbi:Hypothetical protein NTJ_06438 [Nesidiocoris tenuis]|uniref:Uncharacterized protein n=1 Tax=Nesidiocoris tenuis TaxID=355587 RepID=A0ABN7AQQ5_9HEMI|nr:Hypothetical protein NTJ_06438 [Nesidiocoris tenuis]
MRPAYEVSARKIQMIREMINCWTGEYNRPEPPPPTPKVEPIKNCDLKPRCCSLTPLNTCVKEPTNTCGR